MTKMIWAESDGGVIGLDGRLPWYLPEDMKWFKALTINESVIMGRRTWDSLKEPLHKRMNIVLTNEENTLNDARVAWLSTPERAVTNVHDLWVIGGASVYEQFMPYARKLYITRILEKFEGDTFAPKVPERFTKIWDTKELVSITGIHYQHEIHAVD